LFWGEELSFLENQNFKFYRYYFGLKILIQEFPVSDFYDYEDFLGKECSGKGPIIAIELRLQIEVN